MLIEAINKNYDKLNASDMQSLTIIMDDLYAIKDMNIEELAKKCNTSKSTILRLTQKLGFSGFSEFKSCIKWDNADKFKKKDTSDIQNIKLDFLSTCQQMETFTDLKDIVKLIHLSKNVVVYGTGQAQRYCAMEMQRMFMEVNKYIYYIGASDEFRMLSKNLNPDDFVIILSLSGNMEKIKDTMQLLHLKGVKTASITNFHNNPLASLCDYRLYAVSSAVPLAGNVDHNSFVNFLTVLEYIFLSYLREVDKQKTI